MKSNIKLILRIHQIVIATLFLLNLFLNKNGKQMAAIVLSIVLFSLLIQIVIYVVKPEWYGDKTKKHPHEV